MYKGVFSVATSRTMEFVDITDRLQREIAATNIVDGICHIYNPHTTAALTINEGADPAVQTDIVAALKRIVPMEMAYRHMEGNSPAHVMTSLIGTCQTVFVESGRLELGTWQRIFFCEFDGPRTRKVLWRLLPAS